MMRYPQMSLEEFRSRVDRGIITWHLTRKGSVRVRSLRRRWRLAAAAATLAVLPTMACTPEDPPAPPSTPTATPTPSLRPEVRDMYEAVNAYYEGYDEIITVLKDGGTEKPTPMMKATMGGEYLKFVTRAVQPPVTAKGSAQIDGYSVGPQTTSRIPITGCENQRKLRFFDPETGDEIDLGVSGLLVREVVATKGSDGKWRITNQGDNRFVDPKDWKNQPCMATTERPG